MSCNVSHGSAVLVTQLCSIAHLCFHSPSVNANSKIVNEFDACNPSVENHSKTCNTDWFWHEQHCFPWWCWSCCLQVIQPRDLLQDPLLIPMLNFAMNFAHILFLLKIKNNNPKIGCIMSSTVFLGGACLVTHHWSNPGTCSQPVTPKCQILPWILHKCPSF